MFDAVVYLIDRLNEYVGELGLSQSQLVPEHVILRVYSQGLIPQLDQEGVNFLKLLVQQGDPEFNK